jgi:hypothetical protein
MDALNSNLLPSGYPLTKNGRVTLQREATFLIGTMRMKIGVWPRRHLFGEVHDALPSKVARGVPTFLSVPERRDSASASLTTVKFQRRAFRKVRAQLGGPITSATRTGLVTRNTIPKMASRAHYLTSMFLGIRNYGRRASSVFPNVERHRVPLTGTSVVSLTSSTTRSRKVLYPHTGTRARDVSVGPRISYSSNRGNYQRKTNPNQSSGMNSKRTATVRTSWPVWAGGFDGKVVP